MSALTEKQLHALRVIADPDDGVAWLFWEEARRSWKGPRQTLGSLERRGLVSYTTGHWAITAAGREELRLRG